MVQISRVSTVWLPFHNNRIVHLLFFKKQFQIPYIYPACCLSYTLRQGCRVRVVYFCSTRPEKIGNIFTYSSLLPPCSNLRADIYLYIPKVQYIFILLRLYISLYEVSFDSGTELGCRVRVVPAPWSMEPLFCVKIFFKLKQLYSTLISPLTYFGDTIYGNYPYSDIP